MLNRLRKKLAVMLSPSEEKILSTNEDIEAAAMNKANTGSYNPKLIIRKGTQSSFGDVQKNSFQCD